MRKGTKMSEESKKKLSFSHKGKRQPLSEETKRKIGLANSTALRGRKQTEEWKAKMRGRIPWNKNLQTGIAPWKGKKLSEEMKKKISIGHLGQIPWNKGLKGFRGGENHHNWQGGITCINEKIRKSMEYKEWRKAVFKRDDYTCKLCGKRGDEIQADHIKPFALYADLRLDVNNGRTLCKDCHRKTDTFGSKVHTWQPAHAEFFG